MTPAHKGFVNAKVLRINVGFITSESLGFSRETEFQVPSRLRVSEDLMLGHLYATLRLSHVHEGVLVQGKVETSIYNECSRCLDNIWLPIEFEVEELFATKPDLEMEFVVDDNGDLDLAPLIREEAFLLTPMATPSEPDGRCFFCQRTFEEVLRDQGIEKGIDPRLEILKTLRDQLDKSDTDS
jgi:uncharacterized protein